MSIEEIAMKVIGECNEVIRREGRLFASRYNKILIEKVEAGGFGTEPLKSEKMTEVARLVISLKAQEKERKAS